MEDQSHACEHRWRYFVHLASKSVRVKECERCHKRGVIPTQVDPLPKQAAETVSV